MNSDMLLGLVNNTALLLALVVLYETIPLHQTGRSRLLEIVSGIFVGTIGLAIMLTPWRFSEGVIFDTRSILLSLTGLFFGFIPTLIAVLMTGALRIYEGGDGVVMGVSVIITSAGLGLLWRYFLRFKKKTPVWYEFYGFGVVVHLAMLLWTFALPPEITFNVLRKISLPVMLIYPVGTVLLGQTLIRRNQQIQLEKELREERDLFALISETSPVGITMVDHLGHIKYANDYAAEILGLSRDLITQQTYNMPAWKITGINGEPFPENQLPFNQVMDTGKSVQRVIHAIEYPDGQRVLLSINAAPLWDDTGKVNGMVSTIENITQRKQVEDALRLSELDLRQAQAIAHVGNWTWNVIKGEITWSDEMYRIFGVDKNSYTGRLGDVIAKVIHPDDLHLVLPSNAAILANEPIEYRITLSDASIRHIWAKTGQTVFDHDGKPAFLTGIAQDITERKQAEMDLRESEARFRQMFEKHNAVMLLIDPQTGLILDANQSATNFYGYEKSKLCTISINDINTLSPKQVVEERLKALNEKRNYFVFSHRLANKEERVVEVYSSPISFKDKQVLFSIVHDITERKHAEQALLESEAFTKTVLNNLPVGIAVNSVDPTVTFNYMNDNFTKFYRTTREKLADPDAFWSAIYEEPTFREEIKNKILVDLASGDPERMFWADVPITRNGEETTFITARNIPIPDKPLMISTVWDVTEHMRAEKLLRETNEYLENLFNYANAPIIVWDPQFKITRFNHAFETLTGRSAAEVLGKSLEILFPPAQIKASMELIKKTLSGERWEVVEISIQHVDGAIRTVIWNSATLFSVDGTFPIATIAQGQDITERKRAEETIRSLARFPAENPNPVLRITHDGNLIYANQPAQSMLIDWKLEIGAPAPKILFDQIREVNETQGLKTVDMLCGGHIFSITFANAGEYVNLYGSDITERRQVENMIESRLRLVEFATKHSLDELLTHTLDEVCIMTDSPIGFYHFVEPDQITLSLQAWSTRTMQEYCKAEGKGLHYNVDQAGVWVDCIHQRRPVIHNDYFSLPASHRKGLPEGHAQLVRELVVPILRDDLIVAILGIGNKAENYTEKDVEIVAYFADIAWEIAKRKQTEQQLARHNEKLEELVEERTRDLREMQEQLVRQERLATLGQLAGSIGHELRNPLGVISNAIYFLKMYQPNANDKVREYLDIIEKETRTSDKIVTGLLDFTRIKSLDRQPVSIPELFEDTLVRYLESPSVKVVLEIPADLPQVYADPQHIAQILGNLVSNACQAMVSTGDTNGGELTISAAALSDMIRIDVQDMGMGIPPENMKKIFEPLFTTKTKGIGLGLAVSRKLAEANGGRIEVTSELGTGSTFTVHLPIYRKENQ